MRIKKNSSKRVIIISSLATVGLLIVASVVGARIYMHNDDIKRDAKGVSIERTPQDIQQADELNKDPSKKESSQSDKPESPTINPGTDLQKANVVLTNTGQTGNQISASGFVSNVVELDGKCTYTFTMGQRRVEKQGTVLTNSTSTTCKTITFNSMDLGAGKWKVQIQYTSSTSSGVSNEMEVTVE